MDYDNSFSKLCHQKLNFTRYVLWKQMMRTKMLQAIKQIDKLGKIDTD